MVVATHRSTDGWLYGRTSVQMDGHRRTEVLMDGRRTHRGTEKTKAMHPQRSLRHGATTQCITRETGAISAALQNGSATHLVPEAALMLLGARECHAANLMAPMHLLGLKTLDGPSLSLSLSQSLSLADPSPQ